MNAKDFIKKFGWDDAIALANVSKLCGIDKTIVDIVELKKYVNAYELVNRFGGLTRSIEIIKAHNGIWSSFIETVLKKEGADVKILKKSIQLVKEIENENQD